MKSKPANNKSRKQIRKELRKEKKARKHEYYTNRKRGGMYVLRGPQRNEMDEKIVEIKKHKVKAKVISSMELHSEEKRQQAMLEKKMKKQRNQQLLNANADEDRNIKRLEKHLGLNKRKSKNMHKSFIDDGLDYLLEVCDSKNLQAAVATEQQFNEANDDFEEDFELMTGKFRKEKKKRKIDEVDNSEESDIGKDDDFADTEDKDSVSNDEFDVTEDENDNAEEDVSGSEEDLSDSEVDVSDSEVDVSVNEENVSSSENDGEMKRDSKISDKEEHSDTWEDIYGRTRGKDGSVVTKYVPPAARTEMETAESEKLKRLQRQLKGLLNRLAESNIHSIATQIESLYMNNSRNDMNDTLTLLLLNSLVTPVLAPERLMLEHVLLVAILHANIGTEVGAHFLQASVKKFDCLFLENNSIENKMFDNVVWIIAQLYNYKIIQARFVYDILNKIADRFTEADIECILLVLRSIGFALRKDDPLILKNLIVKIQEKANHADNDLRENARVKFMLDVLLAIKNNNMTKIPNYDTTYSDHLKKIQKAFLHKGNYVTTLNISLEDLLKAEEYGKWWVVGSAWTGKIAETNVKSDSEDKTKGFSQTLLDLAKKQRMNTDTRRNIFCIIMSAEDYIDAFEQLLHLGLKNQQEREIIHVILHCCLQEKVFNPYYALLSQKLCEYDRKFQMTIKFSIWDKLKALEKCSSSQLSNLAKLLTHLFLEKGLPISILKIVQFSELDKIALRFIRQVLIGILLCEEEETCKGVFINITQSEKLRLFRESLKLFIQHFLVKNLKSNSISNDQKSLLDARAKLINNVLTRNDKK